MRHLILKTQAQPPYSTYLRIGGEWDKFGMAEVDHMRDMLMLFKFSLDFMASFEGLGKARGTPGLLKRAWGPGVLHPRHVLPGYHTEQIVTDKEYIVFSMWLGRQAYSTHQAIEGMPMRTIEVNGHVEMMRRGLGLQSQLHQHLMTKEDKEAEEKEAERNANKVVQGIDSEYVDEDRLIMHARLPLTVDSGGILSHEDTEKLLTLLAAPFVSLPMVSLRPDPKAMLECKLRR